MSDTPRTDLEVASWIDGAPDGKELRALVEFAQYLEIENAALRHDIERHVQAAADLATEMARAQHDITTLCLRLCMEPNDSHSPDTADVLNRWRKVWEAVAGGMPIDAAIAQGKGEK